MEKISALMDGELSPEEAERELRRVAQNPELQQAWDAYHLVGDVLRGEQLAPGRLRERVLERLELEPTVLAPKPSILKRHAVIYPMYAAASVCAITLVAWLALPLIGGPGETPAGIATAVPANPGMQPVSNVPDDGTMNEYLLAHQGMSPSTALQGLAPYVRTVSVGQPVPGR